MTQGEPAFEVREVPECLRESIEIVAPVPGLRWRFSRHDRGQWVRRGHSSDERLGLREHQIGKRRVETTARTAGDRSERRSRSTRPVGDHGLLGQMHHSCDQRKLVAAVQARKPVPVPAFVNVIERGDRVGPQSELRPQRPRRLTGRSRRLRPHGGGDLDEPRTQHGGAIVGGPRPEAVHRCRVGDIEAVHRPLEREVIVEIPGILGRERGAPQSEQQRRLEQVGQVPVANVRLGSDRHPGQTHAQALLRRESRPQIGRQR